MKKILSIFISFLLIMSFTVPAFAAYNASDVIGQRDGSDNPVFTTSAANNGGAVSARGLSASIRGIKMDTVHHRLFVGDRSNNRVLVYNLDSNNTLIDHDADNVLGQASLTDTTAPSCTATSISDPSGLEYDATNNRLFVQSNHSGLWGRTMIFDLSGGITDGMAASNVLGQPNLTTCNTRSATANSVYYAFDLIYDNDSGLLYNADLAHNRVLVFDGRPSGSAPMTVCGNTTTGITNNMNASCVIGQPNLTTTSSGHTQSKSNQPVDLALDKANNLLFVTECCTNHRITVWDTSNLSSGMNASYVIGQTDFTTITTDTTKSKFNQISGMTLDTVRHWLYVSDEKNHRIMIFDLSGGITNGMDASYVIGADDFTTVNTGPTASTLSKNGGTVYNNEIYLDQPNQRLYVNDSDNARILIFQPTITISGATLSNFRQNRTDTASLPITGDQQTVSLQLTSGSLPDGLTLSSGTITGVATTPGTYSFGLKALDSGIHGIFETAAAIFNLTVTPTSLGSVPNIYPKGISVGVPPTFSVISVKDHKANIQWGVVSDAVNMSFSTDPNFTNGVLIPFEKTSSISIPDGATALYGRAYSSTGNYTQYGPVSLSISTKTTKKTVCTTVSKKLKGKITKVKVCK